MTVSDDALVHAAVAQLARDQLRRDPRPFTRGCDGEIIAFPVVDFCLDYACTKCGGYRSFSAGILTGMDTGPLWAHDPAGQLGLLLQREVALHGSESDPS